MEIKISINEEDNTMDWIFIGKGKPYAGFHQTGKASTFSEIMDILDALESKTVCLVTKDNPYF